MDIKNFFDIITSGKAVSIARLAHGFWEVLADLRSMGYQTGDWRYKNWDDRICKVGLVNDGFLDDLLENLSQGRHRQQNLHFYASSQAWCESERIEGTPVRGRDFIEKMISEYNLTPNDRGALLFKDILIQGKMDAFFEVLRKHVFFLVGPKRLANFGDLVGVKNNFHHLPIHIRSARLDRKK